MAGFIIELLESDEKAINNLYDLIREFSSHFKNVKYPESPWYTIAISEEKRIGNGEFSNLLKENFDPIQKAIQEWGEEFKNIPQIGQINNLNDLVDNLPKIKDLLNRFTGTKYQELLVSIKNMNENLDANKKIIENFTHQTEEIKKDINLTEFHGDRLLQHIQRKYEITRYVDGLFLGMFDYINKTQLTPLDPYFSSNHNAYSDIYNYNQRSKNNPNFWHNHQKNLKEYLTESQRFLVILSILDWIHEDIRKNYRIKESHHLDDVKQDRINEGYYTIENGTNPPTYITIDELDNISKTIYYIILAINMLITLILSDIGIRVYINHKFQKRS
jgi:hypothetical protein